MSEESTEPTLNCPSLPGREPEPQYLVHCETCHTCEAGDPCNCIKGVEDDEFEGAYDGVFNSP